MTAVFRFLYSDSSTNTSTHGWDSLAIGEHGTFTFDPNGDIFRVDTITSAGVFRSSAPLDMTSDSDPTGACRSRMRMAARS